MPGSRRQSVLRFVMNQNAAPKARANSRARYALAFAVTGAALLLAGDVLGAQRQRTAESLAARIIPFDNSVCGYYMIDTSLAPLAQADAALADGMYVPWWLAVVLVIAAVVCAWQAWKDRRRPLLSDARRYRRPRASRPPARAVARRLAVLSALQAADNEPKALTVRQVMTETPVIAPPTTSCRTLMNLLTSAPLRHVLICEHGGRLLGIVTDRDLRHRHGRRAVDVMTRGPVCVPSGAPLGPATALMVDHQISCLPVVDEGRVRGVLTADDVALALECILQAQENAQRQPVTVDETVVLADVQGLCDTVRAKKQSQPTPAPLPPEPAPEELTHATL